MNAIPKIFVVDDEMGARESLRMILKDEYEIFAKEDGTGLVEELRREKADLLLLDIIMPGTDGIALLRQVKSALPNIPVVMVTATKTIRTAVTAMKLGAYDFVNKPYDIDEIRVVVKRALAQPPAAKAPAKAPSAPMDLQEHRIVGDHPKVKDALKMIRKLRDTDSTVLIVGESGTGKELVARCLHAQGARRKKPFIAFNCASLSSELMESELFGHEKGSFTGAAYQKKGMFELAHEGTLFLDEVGDTSIALQAKLLRVLQEKEFRRVGGSDLIKTDVRLIAATNKDLQEAVREGQFRQDLFYRLSVIPVDLAPIRQRREDIPKLLDHFFQMFKEKIESPVEAFSEEAQDCLMRYDWPGNVRELQNVVERVVVTCERSVVQAIDLPPAIRITRAVAAMDVDNYGGDFTMEGHVTRYERQIIEEALRKNNGIMTSTADYLGTTRRILKYKMDKLGIAPQRSRSEDN